MNSHDRPTLTGRRDPGFLLLLVGWFALAVAAIFLRPLWPVDETRYVAVAWEMWLRGDLIVPYLNGEPYSHKPPLLFWLMHAGWALFGVNEWWPRMISPACALASLVLLQRLGRRLWPEAPDIADCAAWVLMGTVLFAALFTLTMFDVLLLACVLLGMLGIVVAAQGERRGFAIMGCAIGLGVLTKGPVILLHLLPAALAAPWWCAAVRGARGRWYRGALAAVLLGTVIALAWALPAAYFGGEIYRNAIFWGQTAGRVTESFAHAAPWWAYAPMLPAVLFPWLWWPPFWRGLRRLRTEPVNEGVRFLLAWLVPTLIAFSLVSGKQAKYLLPLLPGFALLVGCAVEQIRDRTVMRRAMLPPALGVALTGLVLGYLGTSPRAFDLPEWAAELPWWPAVLLLFIAAALIAFDRAGHRLQLRLLSFAMLAGIAVIYVGLLPAASVYGDTAPVAAELSALQQRGVPVAHLGKYHAQFNFAGRLRAPVDIIDSDTLASWVASHPGGYIVVQTDAPHLPSETAPRVERPFRGGWIQVWEAAALRGISP